MKKQFRSKRKLRKMWILEYILLILFTYLLIKLCIYSLVDIAPSSYFNIESIGHEFYFKIRKNTINNPIFLLDYKAQIKQEGNILPVIADSKDNLIENTNKVRIYIYNTHQTEAYATQETVNKAAYDLKTALEKEKIDTYVEKGNINEFLVANNYDYSYSYVASRYYILEELKKNSYDLIIDLHRDAVSRKATTVTINGKNYAKILFVIGKKHDNYEKNYALAKKLNAIVEKKYPTLTRGILLQSGKNVNGIYNQNIAPNMILIELGGNYNTYDEVKNTIEVLAPLLGEYLYGQKV